MITLKDKIEQRATADAELALPYELREKTRLRARLSTGEEAALFLVRGTVLRGGDCLKADDGRVVRIVAAAEPVLDVECHDADEFARCAYHLGNRHTPVQILGRKDDGHYALRIRADHVLADMLAGLGAHSAEALAPFEPEAGAMAATRTWAATTMIMIMHRTRGVACPRTNRKSTVQRRSSGPAHRTNDAWPCFACCDWPVRRYRSAHTATRRDWSRPSRPRSSPANRLRPHGSPTA